MIIKMLEAVSEMINLKNNEIDANTRIERVHCAKTILDKVIEGMKEKPKCPTVSYPPLMEVNSKPKNHPRTSDVEIVAEAGIIQAIKNAKEDTFLLVDGVKMHWQDAIGKSFAEITLL